MRGRKVALQYIGEGYLRRDLRNKDYPEEVIDYIIYCVEKCGRAK